ncbi:MAG: murein DD-endopeptidase MepM/ murein hydrolase activator NlpD [Bradymonadia bacterium]|jgi:murein DD-endopeptidase MepM/ murein hydrolase activator NlpD
MNLRKRTFSETLARRPRLVVAFVAATCVAGCSALSAPARVGPNSTVLITSALGVAVEVARAELTLAIADAGLDVGVLTVASAHEFAAYARDLATTPAQQARAEMIGANLELRELSTQLHHAGAATAEEQPSLARFSAHGTTTTGAVPGDLERRRAGLQRQAVVAVAPPRELISVASQPPSESAPAREAVLARSEMPSERRPTDSPSNDALDRGSSDASIEIWQVPVRDPRVTSRFGPRIDPITGERGRMHRGTDYGHPTGTPIYAPASGRVILAGYCDRGTGNCIVLEHTNGWRSQYFHLSEVSIRSGEEVRQGELMGEIGSTGRSTGPHLHFQVGPPGGGAVDPETILGTPVQ